MAALDTEIRTFEKLRVQFEAEYDGKWVLIHKDTFVCASDTFEAAAKAAISKFGRGPYLIRQVGAPELALQPTLVSRITHADRR